jgi:hypothetical protein
VIHADVVVEVDLETELDQRDNEPVVVQLATAASHPDGLPRTATDATGSESGLAGAGGPDEPVSFGQKEITRS